MPEVLCPLTDLACTRQSCQENPSNLICEQAVTSLSQLADLLRGPYISQPGIVFLNDKVTIDLLKSRANELSKLYQFTTEETEYLVIKWAEDYARKNGKNEDELRELDDLLHRHGLSES